MKDNGFSIIFQNVPLAYWLRAYLAICASLLDFCVTASIFLVLKRQISYRKNSSFCNFLRKMKYFRNFGVHITLFFLFLTQITFYWFAMNLSKDAFNLDHYKTLSSKDLFRFPNVPNYVLLCLKVGRKRLDSIFSQKTALMIEKMVFSSLFCSSKNPTFFANCCPYAFQINYQRTNPAMLNKMGWVSSFPLSKCSRLPREGVVFVLQAWKCETLRIPIAF